MTYHVVAHYRARRDTADEVAALLGELATASRQEPGCVSYAAARDVGDPTHFVIAEAYNSFQDFGAHRATEHFIDLAVNRIIPMLESREVSGGDLGKV